jgi:hypothetical protein
MKGGRASEGVPEGVKGATDLQPLMIFSSDVPGALYLNGRLAGELMPEAETALPVAPRGPVLVEHRPLVAGYLPIARRMTLSAGVPIAVSDPGGVEVAAWPGGALEVLLTPENRAGAKQVYDEDGLVIAMEGGRLTASRGGARGVYPLPQGAEAPEVVRVPGAICLTGACEGGAYLIALGDDLEKPLISASGREASVTPDGMARSLEDLDDVVGHARLTRWALSDGRFEPVSVEHFWTHGAPAWPETPEAAALAALEAARLGLMDEARGYLAPGAEADALQAAIESGGATPLKYPLPDGRPAVGLMTLRDGWLASIRPVFYHASPLGGPQGVWRLDRLTLS